MLPSRRSNSRLWSLSSDAASVEDDGSREQMLHDAHNALDGVVANPSQQQTAITPRSSRSLPRWRRKVHHVSVCIVPPPSATAVWESVSHCRQELRDPGYYRWPPHINLLYPFYDVQSVGACDDGGKVDEQSSANDGGLNEILTSLHGVSCKFEPFEVRLEEFGTFGGPQRGVLWLDPVVSGVPSPTAENNPLLLLQSQLERAFANDEEETSDKDKRPFRPHMTVGHFGSLDAAQEAQLVVSEWWQPMTFPVDHIYLLHRASPEGQFHRVADIPLGIAVPAAQHLSHPQPVAFPDMPTAPDPWVEVARRELQRNRKEKGRRRKR